MDCLQSQAVRPILEVEIFDLWGIDFMGPFQPSDEKEYILVAVVYVSMWDEAIPMINQFMSPLKTHEDM